MAVLDILAVIPGDRFHSTQPFVYSPDDATVYLASAAGHHEELVTALLDRGFSPAENWRMGWLDVTNEPVFASIAGWTNDEMRLAGDALSKYFDQERRLPTES